MTPIKVQHWADAKPWQTNAVLLLVGLAMVLLARRLVSEYYHYTIGFSGVATWSVVLYAAAVWLVLTQPVDRFTFPIIIIVAIVCRLITLFPEPHLSSDVYRYVWDGVVQHAHISPYRYVPGDPALTFLRAPNQDVFNHMNRRDYAQTIYPPAAQFLFYLITFISPTVTFMKLAMVLFEGLTVYALTTMLRELGFRCEQILLYAWCPLLIWEIGGSGHLDSAAMAFIALALLSRNRKKPVSTGVFLGLAILIKFYPLVLLPALFRRGEYKMPATMAALIAFGYACYSSVGMRVFGFLGGYVKEEGMKSGSRYFLLELTQQLPGLQTLPTGVYLLFAGLVFAALLVWCWITCCNPRRTVEGDFVTRMFGLPVEADFLLPAFALAFALMILFSPHYPWYIAWLVPFFALTPSFTVFAYICGLFYLCTTPLAAAGTGPMQFTLNKILYSCVLVAFLVELLFRYWHMRGTVFARTISGRGQVDTLKLKG